MQDSGQKKVIYLFSYLKRLAFFCPWIFPLPLSQWDPLLNFRQLSGNPNWLNLVKIIEMQAVLWYLLK